MTQAIPHVSEYLKQVQKKNGFKTYTELARHLGWALPVLSRYMNGLRRPNATHCAQIADALGIDPLEVIAASESTAEPDVRPYWTKRLNLRKFTPLVKMLAGVSLISIALPYGTPDANATAQVDPSVTGNTHYAHIRYSQVAWNAPGVCCARYASRYPRCGVIQARRRA